jgi:hypothetical protein
MYMMLEVECETPTLENLENRLEKHGFPGIPGKFSSLFMENICLPDPRVGFCTG